MISKLIQRLDSDEIVAEHISERYPEWNVSTSTLAPMCYVFPRDTDRWLSLKFPDEPNYESFYGKKDLSTRLYRTLCARNVPRSTINLVMDDCKLEYTDYSRVLETLLGGMPHSHTSVVMCDAIRKLVAEKYGNIVKANQHQARHQKLERMRSRYLTRKKDVSDGSFPYAVHRTWSTIPLKPGWQRKYDLVSEFHHIYTPDLLGLMKKYWHVRQKKCDDSQGIDYVNLCIDGVDGGELLYKHIKKLVKLLLKY